MALTMCLEADSPLENSGVILLDDKTLQEGIHACETLGESLWGSPPSTPADIKADLDYLLYRGDYDRQRRFWISPTNNTARTIGLDGTIATADANRRYPVLCTQTAPYSTEDYQNTSSPYQVTVHANNEYLTG